MYGHPAGEREGAWCGVITAITAAVATRATAAASSHPQVAPVTRARLGAQAGLAGRPGLAGRLLPGRPGGRYGGRGEGVRGHGGARGQGRGARGGRPVHGGTGVPGGYCPGRGSRHSSQLEQLGGFALHVQHGRDPFQGATAPRIATRPLPRLHRQAGRRDGGVETVRELDRGAIGDAELHGRHRTDTALDQRGGRAREQITDPCLTGRAGVQHDQAGSRLGLAQKIPAGPPRPGPPARPAPRGREHLPGGGRRSRRAR